MKGNTKNIIIIAVILAVVGGAGYMYTTRDQVSTDALLTSQFSTTTSPIDGDLLDALRTLKRLKLDTSIFRNPVWLSLTDFSKEIAPIPSGRPNPFSPLDQAAGAAVPAPTTTAR